MSRGHTHLRKKRDKPREEHAPRVNIAPEREAVSRGESIKAVHGGYTHPWGISYYETVIYPRGGAKA